MRLLPFFVVFPVSFGAVQYTPCIHAAFLAFSNIFVWLSIKKKKYLCISFVHIWILGMCFGCASIFMLLSITEIHPPSHLFLMLFLNSDVLFWLFVSN